MTMTDDSSTLKDLEGLASAYTLNRGWEDLHNPKELAIGIATESAELLQLFRFKSTDDLDTMLGQEAFQEAIDSELGDILFMLTRFATRCGRDLARALERKLAQDSERRWDK